MAGIIESIIIEYLSEQLGIRVATEKPDDNPQRYVLIEKTGSARRNYIDMATVALQSYAESMFEAAALNERVKQVMYDIIALPMISKAELNSDYNFTDTAKKEYRYQAVYDITYF
jgi:hypothetical protein